MWENNEFVNESGKVIARVYFEKGEEDCDSDGWAWFAECDGKIVTGKEDSQTLAIGLVEKAMRSKI
jgi:hypothetical protein